MVEPDIETDQLCNWFLEQEPDVVLRWLYEVWEESRQAPEGFNWPGLAEISPNLAIKQDDLGWARVAVLVNTFLMHEMKTYGRAYYSARIVPPEQRERAWFTYEERVMRLRVRFLLKQDSIPGDPVLDADLLVQSFFEGLTLVPEEALKQYAAGRIGLSREQRWKLDRIRLDLQLLRPLAERGLLPANQELQTWYSLREQLHFS